MFDNKYLAKSANNCNCELFTTTKADPIRSTVTPFAIAVVAAKLRLERLSILGPSPTLSRLALQAQTREKRLKAK